VVALLSGLEHEDHAPRELIAAPYEQARGADQHRDVGIVAAGVHHALHLRSELEAGFLVDGEGIHVRAQQDGRTGLGALERCHHRRQSIALPDAQA
jgi:hypothetical protein